MWRFLWITAIVVALDQGSKWWAVKTLKFTQSIEVWAFIKFSLVYNSGAAFGFLSNAPGWQNLLFVGVAIVASFIILAMVKRLGANDVQVAIGLMLILGGAIGNLIDRLTLGYVVDFIDLTYWPVFNIADSAITVGAVLLLLDVAGLGVLKKFGNR